MGQIDIAKHLLYIKENEERELAEISLSNPDGYSSSG
jgi:hypothetical protein